MRTHSAMKKSAAVALLAAGMAAAATPAWADATATNSSAMLLDCAKGVSNGDAYASCFGSFSEEWRLRADCPFQPDRYSSWQSGDGNVTVSCTLGDARTAIIELR